MTSSRLALFVLAAAVAVGSLVGSAQLTPAAAWGLGSNYSWMGNKKYMDCLRYVGAFGADYPGRDKNIGACKREYLPGGR